MGQTVLITGASSGIGKATAVRFQKAGWNVAATMRDPAKGADWANLPRVAVIRLDVTDGTAVEEAAAETVRRFGVPDVVVNNAGYGLVGPFEAATSEQIARQFETNVFGVMRVTRTFLPLFREKGAGLFINVTSMGGRITFPLYSLYHATKWSVEGFSEAIQFELRPFNIRVKIVEPGPIKTDFYDRSMDLISTDLDVYNGYIEAAMPKMQEAGESGASPERVASTIFRAAADPSWKLRYPVNAKAILSLRRLLPDRLFLAVIRKAVVRPD